VVLKGTVDNSSFAFWVQSAPQLAGACIVSMVETIANDRRGGRSASIGVPRCLVFPGAGQFDNIRASSTGSLSSPARTPPDRLRLLELVPLRHPYRSALVFWARTGSGNSTVSNGGGLGLRVPLFGSNGPL